MGTALLSSCGGGGSASGGGSGTPPPVGPGPASPTPLPNGFVPSQVFGSGSVLPDKTRIMAAASPTPTNCSFNGLVHLDNGFGETFCAFDANGLAGLYRTKIDYGAAVPTPGGTRLVIKEEINGAIYPANTIVRPKLSPTIESFGTGSTNAEGVMLLKVSFSDAMQGLYVDHGSGLEPLFVSYDKIPNQSITLGQSVSATATLHEGNDILFVADFTRTDDSQPYQGLFYLPQGQLSQAQLLLTTGDVLSGSNAIVRSIALSSFNDGLQYIVQGTALLPGAATPGTFCLKGQVGGSQTLLSASPKLQVPGALAGELYYAPRLGPASRAATAAKLDFRDLGSAGQTAMVVHTDPSTVALVIDGAVVLRGGGPAVDGKGYLSLSPRGEPITNINPPCIGSDGHIYFQLTTTAGFELVATNGAQLRTLVASGDVIGGRTVSAIIMGAVPDQVDSSGHVTFEVEYTDFSSGIIVASPV